RQGVTGILNALLADEYVLYTKTRNFHWNVTGANFHELHAFFQAQYEELDEIIDQVAERVRALGERPASTLREFLKISRLTESDDRLNSHEMLQELLADHESLIRQMREDLEEAGSRY